jgi:signal transduction histidine kinase
MLRRPAARVVAAAIVSAAATAFVTQLPPLDYADRQPELHVGFETAAALIALLAAYLLFGRFRRRRRVDDLALFISLSLFALSNLFFAALPAMLDLSAKFSTWAGMSGRLLGATALAVGAFVPARRVYLSHRATVGALIAPVAVLAATAIVVGLLFSSLPSGVDAQVSGEAFGATRLVGHPAALAAQLVVASLFAAAAVGFARRSERERDAFVEWLAVASVLAAFSRFHYGLYPSLDTDWIYTGDAFRLLFYILVLMAALREISSYWEAASRAAVLEERRRIARDLHDGLAQELAFVGRNVKRLDQENPYARRAAAGVARGLDDARRAITALADPIDEPLDVALARTARDVAAREGTHVSVALPSDIVAPAETREALVRIVSEAITNAARHGRANLVRVEVQSGTRLRLRVRDTGTGFDPSAVEDGGGYGFGLRAMRERAAALGGEFQIRTERGRGTEVEVVL